MDEKCTWEEDRDGNWNTACDRIFTMTADTPTENDYRFCPGCGKPIVEVLFAYDVWDE